MEGETRSPGEILATHSHIIGLGESDENIEYIKDGLVSQLQARKALMIYKKLILNNKCSKHLLIKGPSSSGKSALINGLRENLKQEIVFNSLSASELLSVNLSMAEELIQSVRNSIYLKIKETIRAIEGEVTSISLTKLTLRTVDVESSFEIGTNMKEQLKREKVSVGDIIRIIKERGKIIKLGISSSKNDPQILGDLNIVSCPEGDLFTIKEEVQYVSLHEIDAINNKTLGYLSLFDGTTTEICDSVRDEVNNKVKKWILEGKAELIRGVLHIDDVHLLNGELLTLLNKILDDVHSPFIILSTNKEENLFSRELLDRLLVIETVEYNDDDIKNVLMVKSEHEKIVFETGCIEKLTKIALSCGINYAINVARLSDVRRNKLCKEKVDEKDIDRICQLFADHSSMSVLFK